MLVPSLRSITLHVINCPWGLAAAVAAAAAEEEEEEEEEEGGGGAEFFNFCSRENSDSASWD